MKNKLAENMLRFGVKNLTESNIKKLQEQDPKIATDIAQPGEEANPLPDTPKSPEKLVDPIKNALKGTTANFVLSLLKYNNFLSLAKNGNLLIDINGFSYAYAKYLGGPKLSSLDQLIGKTMLRFKSPNWFKREALNSGGKGGTPVVLENNMLDSHLAETRGMYPIKAALISRKYKTFSGTGTFMPFLALSPKSLTTNYSGDDSAPIIVHDDGGKFRKMMPTQQDPIPSIKYETPANIKIPLGVDGRNDRITSLPKDWKEMMNAPSWSKVYLYGNGTRNLSGAGGNDGYPGDAWQVMVQSVPITTGVGDIQLYRAVGAQAPN